MEKLKYIVVKSGSVECAVVFDAILTHNDVAAGLDVVSAGFCYLPDKLNPHVNAWGNSVSLQMANREQDAGLIERAIGSVR